MSNLGTQTYSVTPRRLRKTWRWVLLLLVILAAAFWYWRTHSAAPAPKGKPQAPIAVTPVSRKDVPVYLNGLGTIQAYNTVTVHSQVDGKLVEVRFQEGQDVKKGDVIAVVDPRTFQAQYDQAVATKAKDEALLANARVDLKRYNSLGNTISKQTRDTQAATVLQDEATVQADQANIENFATQLSYTSIVAPITGRTGIRQVDQGNIVHPGDTTGVVVITQLKPISVVFSLPQQNIAGINNAIAAQKGNLSTVAVNADNSVIDQGKLALMDNEIDQTTGTVRLKATFPNPNYALWPGGFVNVRLLTDTLKNAMVVPAVAIQRNQQNAPYVFVYNPADSTVKVTVVKLGILEGADAVILDGLNDGDQVVTDGMAKLQDGAKASLASDAKNDDTTAKPDNKPDPDKKSDADSDEKKAHHHKKDKEG